MRTTLCVSGGKKWKTQNSVSQSASYWQYVRYYKNNALEGYASFETWRRFIG